MRATKRIAALALTLVFVITSMVSNISYAATFSDVDTTYQFYKAIDDLVSRGILNGYEDGTFKPEGDITRAEFSKIIAVASAPESMSFNATETGFPDVPSDNWAAPYVSYAASTGLVKGYDDGTFGPDRNVTYAEAVTMIMRALNYGQAAVAETYEGEQWYAGYIRVANKAGVTTGAMSQPEVPATRGLVCQLIYNMNQAHPMVQTGVDVISGEPIYEVNTEKTYEDSVKKTTSYTGQVLGVYSNTVNGIKYGLTKRQIRIKDKVFDIGSFTLDSLNKYLGYEVTVNYREDNSTSDLILSTISMTNRNATYEVDDSQLDDVDSTTVSYYKNEDDNKATELRINSGITNMIYNGCYTDFDISLIEDLDSGSITFLDSDNDDIMDVAFITSYRTFYLSSVVESDGLYTFYDKYQQYDPVVLGGSTNETITVKSTSDGKKFNDVELRNVSKDSIISIAQSLDESTTEVIASTWSKSGSVEEKDSALQHIVIGTDSNEYAANEYYKTIVGSNSDQEFAVGDTAKFYLDFLGRLTAIKLTTSTSTSYGYVAGYVEEQGALKSETRTIKMVPNSGSAASSYMLKANVRLNGGSSDAAEAVGALADAATTINKDKVATITKNAEHAGIVKYDASGTTINAIYTVADGAITASHLTDGSTKLTYTSGGNAFKQDGTTKFSINSSTKVFIVPNDRTDTSDYKVMTGTSYFENEVGYYIDAYDVENSIAKAVVVYNASAVSVRGNTTPIMVLGKTKITNSDDEQVWKVTYQTIGGTLSSDASYAEAETDSLEIFDDVAIGDIVRVATAGGVIEACEMLYDGAELYDIPDESGNQDTMEVGMVTQNYSSTTAYFKAMVGTVVSRPTDVDEGGVITIAPAVVEEDELDDTGAEAFSVDADTKVYLYDSTKNDSQILAESSLAAVVDAATDVATASKILIISMNDDVKGIVIVK